jgi:hypothetical protein
MCAALDHPFHRLSLAPHRHGLALRHSQAAQRHCISLASVLRVRPIYGRLISRSSETEGACHHRVDYHHYYYNPRDRP